MQRLVGRVGARLGGAERRRGEVGGGKESGVEPGGQPSLGGDHDEQTERRTWGPPESLGREGPGPRLTSPEKIAEDFRETGNRDG